MIHQFLETLVRLSLQATLLGILVLGAQAICGDRISAAWRHALWLPVVVRLLLPAGPESPWSMFNLASPEWLANRKPNVIVVTGSGRTQSAPELERAKPSRTIQHSYASGSASSAPEPKSAREVITLCLFAAWGLGVSVFLIRLINGHRRLATRLEKAGPPTDPAVQKLFLQCRDEFRIPQRVQLCETSELESPGLFGFFKTRLLIPTGLLDRLSERERKHVFRHELAHLKRHDVTWNYLLTLLHIVHWFNPLLWMIFNRMKTDREIACDSLALAHTPPNDVQSYGETVIRLVQGMQRSATTPCLVGITEDRARIKDRIRMIARFGQRQPSSAPAVLILSILALTGLSEARNGSEQTLELSAKRPQVNLQFSQTEPVADSGRQPPNVSLELAPANPAPPPAKPDPNTIESAQKAADTPPPAAGEPPSAISTELQPQVKRAKESLYTRTFRVDPNTILESLQAMGIVQNHGIGSNPGATAPRGSSGRPEVASENGRVSNPSPAELQAGIRKLFERSGVFLDSALQADDPQRVKSLFYNDRNGILFVRATLRDLDIVETILQPLNTAPPQVTVEAKIVEVSSTDQRALGFDWFLGQGSNTLGTSRFGPVATNFNNGGDAGTITGILTDPQFRVMLRTLGQRNLQLLAAPRVTTLSGRSAMMSMLKEPTPEEAAQKIPATGPSLEVLPAVAPDGFTIRLKVDFTFVETIPDQRRGILGNTSKLPRIQKRQLSTTATIWDGQTMVLAAMQDPASKKQLLVFLTPTIIDPAGNRVHQPEKLPYDSNTTPRQ